MFQSVYTARADADAQRSRADWLSLIARAPQELLESALSPHLDTPIEWLRRPETGLMMVQARAGGSAERFNLGEITVTRCTVRVTPAQSSVPLVGVGYLLGRSHRRAHLAALADALLQNDSFHAALSAELLRPTRDYLARLQAERTDKAQRTKVEFFTVARESSGAEADEREEV